MADPNYIETPLFTGATDHPVYTEEDRARNEASARAAGFKVQHDYTGLSGPQPPAFKDWVKKFDANSSAEDYDKQRQHYFNMVVAPRLGAHENKSSAWDYFKTKTERPPLKWVLLELKQI